MEAAAEAAPSVREQIAPEVTTINFKGVEEPLPGPLTPTSGNVWKQLSIRRDTVPAWMSFTSRVLGFDERMVQQRGPVTLVVCWTLGFFVLLTVLSVLIFGWGTRWQLLPLYWAPLFLAPICTLPLYRLTFTMTPEDFQRNKTQLALGLTVQFAEIIPAAYACFQIGDSFPLWRFQQSRLWFPLMLYPWVVSILGSFWFVAPGNNDPHLTFRRNCFNLFFSALRIADTLVDLSLVAAGFRQAAQGICPFRDTPSGNCAAHFGLMAVMTACIFVDHASIGSMNTLIAVLDLDSKAKTLMLRRSELVCCASQCLITACAVIFVACRMTSESANGHGISKDYVIACGVMTVLLAAWTFYLFYVPAQVRERVTQRIQVRLSSMRRISQVAVAPQPSSSLVEPSSSEQETLRSDVGALLDLSSNTLSEQVGVRAPVMVLHSAEPTAL